MKKITSILLLLAVVFMLGACSSKPNKEELIVEANRFVATDSTGDPYYTVEGEYSDDYNNYFVIITVNESYYLNDYKFEGSVDKETYLGVVEIANKNKGSITKIVDYMFEEVKAIFEDSDVDVTVGYQSINGEYIETRTTMEN